MRRVLLWALIVAGVYLTLRDDPAAFAQCMKTQSEATCHHELQQ